jgi:hypothetical protein
MAAPSTKGLRFGGLTAEETLALERPAMTYVRGQLPDRLGQQVAQRTGGACTRPATPTWRHFL